MKNRTQKILFLSLILLALFPLSCVVQPSKPVRIKNGKEYGKVQGAFRHRWWNYYERGLSFVEGEFFPEAIEDFIAAIKQREKDQRMARTYGMHFIDYFPHRELGIVYYEKGDMEAAKRELEDSLSYFPSAKARFYLDRVRKILIEREGKEIMPPMLDLSFEADEIWTNEDPVVISGMANDENYITGITIKDIPFFLEGAQNRVSFKEYLDLPQGRQIVEVTAKNLLGKETRREVIINVDREGPVIRLDKLDLNRFPAEREITIYGSIYDEAGVSGFSINRQLIPIGEGMEVPFTARFKIAEESLEMAASDSLDNITSANILLEEATFSQRPVMLAFAGQETQYDLLAGLFGSKDSQPPVIRLKGWTDSQTVYMEKGYIEGSVSDENRIESLMINEIPIRCSNGRHVFFSHMTDLKEGENVVTIQARDEKGNTAIKKILIISKIPKALQLSERLSLTVFPFEQGEGISAASFNFQHNLIDALVKRNRFRVIEREKLDTILQEQKLSRTKLFDDSTALRLGRLIAVNSIVAGSIIETRTGIEIVARMIDTETSDILASEDVYGEIKDINALMSLAEGMAVKFHKDFPLVNGLIIKCKEKEIVTDLGHDVIKLYRRLIVYREEEIKHPITNRILGADTKIIGRARITQVMTNMSQAELMGCKPGTIDRMDKVITE
ncbi:MAG: CsgG/HfaB family protein [bacterium]